MHSNSFLMQRRGVHNFFDQDSQQQQSGSGNWPWAANSSSADQSHLFYSGMYGTDEVNASNFLLKADGYGPNVRLNYSASAISGSEVENADVGVSSVRSFMPAAVDPVDIGKSPQMMLGFRSPQENSTVIKSQPRTQPLNVEGLLNNSQSSQFKSSHSAPIGNITFPHHSGQNNVGGLDGQGQNQNCRFDNQNLGGATMRSSSYDFLSNSIVWKGQEQGLFPQQIGGTGRPPVGTMESQLLHQQSLQTQQLHEMHQQLVAQQLKLHSEQSRQQEMQPQSHLQFPGISYSALLHGHDAPSPQSQSQPQPFPTTGGMSVAGLENHGASCLASNFPTADTAGQGWPMNGSYYPGLTHDFQSGQDPNLAWQLLASKGPQVDPSMYADQARDRAGPAASFYPGAQNMLPDHLSAGLKLPPNPQVGKPVPRNFMPGNSIVPEVQTDNFGFGNGSNNDKSRHWVFSRSSQGQNPQHFNEQPMDQNQMGNSLHQMNMMSKSQNQFQDFQVSMQRNWGPSEDRWDVPFQRFPQSLEVTGSVLQNFPNAQNSNMQKSSGQHVNNFDTRRGNAASGQNLQHDNYQTGISESESVVGFRQQQCWADIEHENNRQGFNTENFHSDSGNVKQNIWGGNFLQQGNYLSGNSFPSIDAFDTRRAGLHVMQSTQQGTSKDGMGSPAAVADNNFQPNQKNPQSWVDLRARQESSWIENERVPVTVHMLHTSLEPDGNSQGSWKNQTPSNQSPFMVETAGPSADGDGHARTWTYELQQGNVEVEAPQRMKLAPRKPNMASRQELQASQQTHIRTFTGEDAQHQQSQSQDGWNHFENHPAVNFAMDPGEQEGNLPPNVSEDTGNHEKSIEPEVYGAFGQADVDQATASGSMHLNRFLVMGKSPIEKQREVAEQIDGNASAISLAHFRRNQSSSPLSPQSIRLGLGPPSNLSQVLQQDGNAKTNNFGHAQGLDGELSGSGTVGKDHYVQSNSDYSGYGSHFTRVDRIDSRQAGVNMLGFHGRVLQNPSVSSSVQTSNIAREVQSEILPPSSLASGQPFLMEKTEGSHVVVPGQFVNPFKNGKGAGASQVELNLGKFLAAAQTRATARTGGYTQEQFLMDGMRQSSSVHGNANQQTHVGGIRHNMQDQHMTNMAMQQLRDRAQAAEFSGLLSSFKASLAGHTKYMGGHEKPLPGVLESCPPYGGPKEDVAHTMLDAHRNVRNSVDLGIASGEGPSSVPWTNAGSHTYLEECNNQLKIQQGRSFSPLEARGLGTLNLRSNLQEQMRPSPGQMPPAGLNGAGPSTLQARGPGQDQELKGSSHFSPFRVSIGMPSQNSGHLRGANKLTPDKISPGFLVQDQPIYHQTDTSSEDLSFSQTSEGLLYPDARAAFMAESSAIAGGMSNESIKKPPKNKPKLGISGNEKANVRGGMSQQPVHAVAPMGQNRSLFELKAMLPQNASTLEQQAADNVPFVHAPNQVFDNLVVGASSMSCLGKGMNLKHVNVEASCSNVPQSGSNDQLIASQASVFHNVSASGRAHTLSQQFLAQNPGRVIAYSGQSSCPPVGVVDSALKDGEARFFARNTSPLLNQISQQQLSPLRSSFHGPVAIHPKKRRKLVPPLIPWHVVAAQPTRHLQSTSEAELLWAHATNCLPEKDDGESHDGATSSVSRAKRRLRLTTQLMQQLIPPIPFALMHGNRTVDNECATYYLTRHALGDACRLVAASGREAEPARSDTADKSMVSHRQEGTWSNAMTRLVESFVERIKRLDGELARLDCSTSALELKGEIHDLEKVSIVNRFARHHGTGFAVDCPESRCVENISDLGPGLRRPPPPQKYVTAVPMPRTLPEGVSCLSL